MEFFGKVNDVVLSRQGTSQAGNAYEIHTVVMSNGAESIVFDVFGTKEHLDKYGLCNGAEGKATIKMDSSHFNGKYYQRNTMLDVRNDFKSLMAVKPEGQQQVEMVAETAKAAKASKPAENKKEAASDDQPEPKDDLPF